MENLLCAEDAHHGVRREKGAGWEQVTDHAEQQIRKGLTLAEESRDSIGDAGTTNDDLQCGAQALSARYDLAPLIIQPLDVRLRETTITLGKG